MLYGLYRLLNIPMPCTDLLVLTRISDNDPAFYAVQACGAVLGESPKSDVSYQEKLWPESDDLANFCQ